VRSPFEIHELPCELRALVPLAQSPFDIMLL